MLRFPRPSRFVDFARSRVRPLDIKLETVQNVLKQYDLTLAGKPSNLPLSRRTGNIVLPTKAGKKVLKRYRDHLQPAGIEYIHSILLRLQELSVPSPTLVAMPSGENFTASVSGKYAIFDFIEGSNYSLDFILPADRARLIEASGKVLANFHKSLNGFLPKGAHHLGFASYTGDWQRDIHWFANKVVELRKKSAKIANAQEKETADWLVSHSDDILEAYNHLDASLRNINLMRTIIHGDFGLHNLIFQKDGRIVITDYETARLEWRLGDLVSTLSRSRSQDTMYRFESIKRFLAGYQSVYPIPLEEWQSLAKVWQFFKLRSVFINWNSYFERGGSKLSSALDAYHQAEWAQANADTLLKLRDL